MKLHEYQKMREYQIEAIEELISYAAAKVWGCNKDNADTIMEYIWELVADKFGDENGDINRNSFIDVIKYLLDTNFNYYEAESRRVDQIMHAMED